MSILNIFHLFFCCLKLIIVCYLFLCLLLNFVWHNIVCLRFKFLLFYGYILNIKRHFGNMATYLDITKFSLIKISFYPFRSELSGSFLFVVIYKELIYFGCSQIVKKILKKLPKKKKKY